MSPLVHQLFEEQVRRTPGALAVIYETHSLTYAELNARANQLAHFLRQRGIGPDQLVGICVERSVEMVVGLLGILKAGGAYVPLDPTHPAERLQYMLSDAAPRMLLTQEHLRKRLPPTAAEVIALDAQWSEIAQQRSDDPDARARDLRPNHLAYVIYTSGSTGQPKGAMNEHRGVVNRLQWMQDEYRLGPADRVLQKTPFSFDVSGWEFFWTLMSGARLIVARPEGHKDPGYLRALIEATGVTTLHFVPSMLRIFLDQHRTGECSSLRHIVCSGEELPVALQRKCLERLPQARLSNLYGPTEAAIDVTAWECSPDDDSPRVPIGSPIANIRMYVLDSQRQPVPAQEIGEIYIGGVGVGRGYLNRPQLTAERFIADPFSTDAQSRLYRTGDLGRWRTDGNLEYLGRNDSQAKIRGFRIELGEIEARVLQHPGVKEAVVLACDDESGEKRLVAYVVGSALIAELRESLKAHLPDYMMPSAWVLLRQLPLSANGKLDRRALPAPDPGAYRSGRYEAPQGEVEEILAGIWQELLHVERVGRADNFFELGGHSLTATRLMQRVAASFAIQLHVQDVTRNSNFREMAQFIAAARSGTRDAPASDRQEWDTLELNAPIVSREVGCRIPLTARQLFLWKAAVAVNGSPRSARISGNTVRMSGPLNVYRLQQSIEAVVSRHEALRTRFVELEGVPAQHVDAACEAALDVIDLSDSSRAQAEEEVSEVCQDFLAEKVEYTIGPLFAAKLFKLAEQEHILLLGFHHMVSDGTSLEIVCREIWTFYRQATQGVPLSLPTVPAQFADYAVWQARTAAAWMKLHSAYWRQKLQGIPPTKIPRDEGLAGGEQLIGATLTIPFGRQLSLELRAAASRARTIPALVALTAYVVVMSKWCGLRDLIIGLVSNGRFRPELIDMVGWLSGPLYLRIEVAEQDSFLDLLKKVGLEFNSAYEHYDFNRVPELIPGSLTELSFNCVPDFVEASAYAGYPWEAGDQLRIQPFPFRMMAPMRVLSFAPHLYESDSQMAITVNYRPDFFSRSTIEKFGSDMVFLAREFVDLSLQSRPFST